MTATPSVAAIVAANRRYAAAFEDPGLPAEPRRQLAVVTCMDARLDVFAALGLELGDAHVLRNAGGVVTDDVLRSLLLSQRALGTCGVVLVHHTRCGLDGLDEARFLDEVAAATGARPDLPLHAFADVEEDVRASVERVRAAAFLPRRDAVHGFVYDVDSGRLHTVV